MAVNISMRASVADVEDASGYKVRDNLFNDGPVRVDGFVVFFVMVLQFTVRGSSFRSDKIKTALIGVLAPR